MVSRSTLLLERSGNPSESQFQISLYAYTLAIRQNFGGHGSPTTGRRDDQKKARESGQRFASLQPLKPQSCCTSGCSHPASFCGPFPEGRWAVHWANDPNEQPTEVDCLTLLRGLVDPGLLFGVKGIAFAAQRSGLLP